MESASYRWLFSCSLERVKLVFWLSTHEPSGGAKVLLEHAHRLAARGHETSVVRGAGPPPLAPGDALVVTRYRDVEPALATRARVLHLVQGLDLVAEGGLLRRLAKRRRVARAFAASTRKLCVARHLVERFPGSRLAPTGVDLGKFAPGEPAPRRVLLSGRGPTKQIDLAFRALEKIRDVEIVHLHPTAGLGEDQVAALIRTTRVYLSTVSPDEGFDLVALEAMASGVACVLSGGGAHRELAPELVEGFDPSRLGAAVAQALDDPAEHARRAALGLEAARQRSWDVLITEVESAYRHAVEGRSP
jgi:glycosyltransferase involved in cell wall biosynthesis